MKFNCSSWDFISSSFAKEVDQPLFTIHSDAPGALDYAVGSMRSAHDIINVSDSVVE